MTFPLELQVRLTGPTSNRKNPDILDVFVTIILSSLYSTIIIVFTQTLIVRQFYLLKILTHHLTYRAIQTN